MQQAEQLRCVHLRIGNPDSTLPAVCAELGFEVKLGPNNFPITHPQCLLALLGQRGKNCELKEPSTKESGLLDQGTIFHQPPIGEEPSSILLSKFPPGTIVKHRLNFAGEVTGEETRDGITYLVIQFATYTSLIPLTPSDNGLHLPKHYSVVTPDDPNDLSCDRRSESRLLDDANYANNRRRYKNQLL